MQRVSGSSNPVIVATVITLLASKRKRSTPATAPVPTTAPAFNACQIVTYLEGEFSGRERTPDGVVSGKTGNAGNN